MSQDIKCDGCGTTLMVIDDDQYTLEPRIYCAQCMDKALGIPI